MIQTQNFRQPARTEKASENIGLRNLKPKDCPLLERLLSRIPVFDKDDEILAMELIEQTLKDPGQKDYMFLIAVNADDFPVGYACFGPTPLTEGTFDLYWIAVDPALAGRGVGSMLLAAIEQEIRRLQGRMLIIETSSGQAYRLTRQFYLKNKYILAETIPDFYRDGEDRVTFIKKF